MADGRIEQVGTPAEIYTEPATRFVAEFVGTTNRFDCQVVDEESVTVDEDGTRVRVGRHGRPRDETRDRTRSAGGNLDHRRRRERRGQRVVAPGDRVSSYLPRRHTRLGLESALGVLVADVPSTLAVTLPLGSDVHVEFDSAAIRLLPRP